ncbi:hypothetical protein [Niallia circulans]|uniref:hypothetical protein n=1 Tax=Niallia circulans TaxID=1397 RepID=UPI0035188BEA
MTTIQEVIDKLLEPAKMVESTTDVLIKGSADSNVKGIVTAFMLTQQVLEKAISMEQI